MQPDTDIQEEEEDDELLEEDINDIPEKTEWEKLLDKNEDEKREIYKTLTRYGRSEEFKALKEKMNSKEEELRGVMKSVITIRTAKPRKPIASKLDMYLIMINETEKIIPDTHDALALFLKDRNTKLMSAVENKMEEGFDIQMYSEIDVLKQKISVYHSLSWYLDICRGYFDIDKQKRDQEEAEKSRSAY